MIWILLNNKVKLLIVLKYLCRSLMLDKIKLILEVFVMANKEHRAGGMSQMLLKELNLN